jgi:hypothetical protein
MAGLDFARPYLDDLMIISTEKGFDKHLEKLEYLEYLGYNISREGMRPSQESRSNSTN